VTMLIAASITGSPYHADRRHPPGTPTDQPREPAAHRSAHSAAASWRAVLEARWRARLRKLIEVSVAYHDADAAGPADDPGQQPVHTRRHDLLGQAVAARQALADTEHALGRLASGGYGRCEQCSQPIPPPRLAATPETRYCARCDDDAAASAAGTGRVSQ
jgi:DnaK suppressor protein